MMPGLVATGLGRVGDSMRGLQLSSGISSSSSSSATAASSATGVAATSSAAVLSESSSATAHLPPPSSGSASTVAVSYSISLSSASATSAAGAQSASPPSAAAHNDRGGGCVRSQSRVPDRPDLKTIADDDDHADDKETRAANGRRNTAATPSSDPSMGETIAGVPRCSRGVPAAPYDSRPRSDSWVQLSGHEGSLMPSHSGTVLKRFCPHEQRCLQLLMSDAPLRAFVPEYHGDTTVTTVTATVTTAAGAAGVAGPAPARYSSPAQRYNRMQDLLAGFRAPAAMDCKMGVRTYLEEELALARRDPQPRADMLAKMVAVDATAPTAAERACGAVTKPRYMQWRELCSSSASLGFRVEATKRCDGTLRQDFKTTKSRDEVRAALEDFLDGDLVATESYIRRLHALRSALEVSPFFRSHEVIGSSLLFVHEAGGPAGVWMIDFSKTRPLPPGGALDHRSAWREGNREDGYLGGLDNLIAILEEVAAAAVAERRGRR